MTPFSSDRQTNQTLLSSHVCSLTLYSKRWFLIINRKQEVEDAYMNTVYMSIMYEYLTEACILFSWAFSTSYLWCSAFTWFSKNPLSSLIWNKKITVLVVILVKNVSEKFLSVCKLYCMWDPVVNITIRLWKSYKKRTFFSWSLIRFLIFLI